MGFIYIHGWPTLASQDSWQQKASLPSPIFWAQFQVGLLDQAGKGKQQFQVMKIYLGGGWGWHKQYTQQYLSEVSLHEKSSKQPH